MSENLESIVSNIPVTPLAHTLIVRLPDGALIGERVGDLLERLTNLLEPNDTPLTIDEAGEMLDQYEWEYILSRYLESEFAKKKVNVRITRDPENGGYTITEKKYWKKCPIIFCFSESQIKENESYKRDEINIYLPSEAIREISKDIREELGEINPGKLDEQIKNILKERINNGYMASIYKKYKDSIKISFKGRNREEEESISEYMLALLNKP